MDDLDIVEKALTETAHECACHGTHDGDIMASVLRAVAAKIWVMKTDQNPEKENDQ